MRREMQLGGESIDLDRWENEGGRCRIDLLNQENESLHRVLVGMSRGLLQYASQCRMWAPPNDRHRSALLSHLASQQQESIRRLCELLEERRFPISWGVFPAEYTHFNDVARDYLWSRITEFQSHLVRMLNGLRKELEHDRQASDVLDEIVQTESEVSAELEQASLTHNSRQRFPRTPTTSRDAGNTSLLGVRPVTSALGACFDGSQTDRPLRPSTGTITPRTSVRPLIHHAGSWKLIHARYSYRPCFAFTQLGAHPPQP